MAELSDAFIALPGGIGTLEELFEVYTWAQLGIHAKPLGLLDVAGYYQPLVAFLDHAVQERFLRPEMRTLLAVSDDLDDLLARARGVGAGHPAQVDRPRPDVTAVFDGHNDALGKLQADDGAPADFLTGLPERDIDLPRARAGGLAGGLFAINAPSPHDASGGGSLSDMPVCRADRPRAGDGVHRRRDRPRARAGGGERRRRRRGHRRAPRWTAAAPTARWPWCCTSRAPRRSTPACRRSTRGTPPACDRSASSGAGPAPSATACPSASPPRRTPAPGSPTPGARSCAAARSCGILVDVSHLNAAGLRRRRAPGGGPVVASHTRVPRAVPPPRATSPTTSCARSAAATGIVGIVFAPAFVRADGADDADTPLSTLVAHVRHAAEVAGIDHVGLGSDFDGAPMPAALATWPPCRACSRRCATTASAPTRCSASPGATGGACSRRPGRLAAPTPRAAARTRRCRPRRPALDHALAQDALAREAQALGQGERAGVVGRRGQLEAPHPGWSKSQSTSRPPRAGPARRRAPRAPARTRPRRAPARPRRGGR